MAITKSSALTSYGIIPTRNSAGTILKDLSKTEHGPFKIVTVYAFKIFNFEDPVIEVAEHLWRWEQSDEGQWIMSNALEQPVWHKNENIAQFCIDVIIRAKLLEKHLTFWALKWRHSV